MKYLVKTRYILYLQTVIVAQQSNQIPGTRYLVRNLGDQSMGDRRRLFRGAQESRRTPTSTARGVKKKDQFLFRKKIVRQRDIAPPILVLRALLEVVVCLVR